MRERKKEERNKSGSERGRRTEANESGYWLREEDLREEDGGEEQEWV